MNNIFKCTTITVGTRTDGSPFYMGTFTEHASADDMRDDISIGRPIKRIISDVEAIDGNGVLRENLIRKRGIRREFKTTDYTIGDRTVNKLTVLVFDQEDAIDIANNLLKRNGACVLKADGTPSVAMEIKTPSKTEIEISVADMKKALKAKGLPITGSDEDITASYETVEGVKVNVLVK